MILYPGCWAVVATQDLLLDSMLHICCGNRAPRASSRLRQPRWFSPPKKAVPLPPKEAMPLHDPISRVLGNGCDSTMAVLKWQFPEPCGCGALGAFGCWGTGQLQHHQACPPWQASSAEAPALQSLTDDVPPPGKPRRRVESVGRPSPGRQHHHPCGRGNSAISDA